MVLTKYVQLWLFGFFIDNWQIQQHVVRLMLLAKSLTGKEVARQAIMYLSNEFGVS